MTGRPPLPWWDRRQAKLVAAAARRSGLDATARLDGWLDITTPENGQSVAEAQFSMSSGSILRASGRTADVTPTTGRYFHRDGTNYYTAREVTDAFCEWLVGGRLAEYDAREFLQQRRTDEARKQLGLPPVDDRPLAVVTDMTVRRARR